MVVLWNTILERLKKVSAEITVTNIYGLLVKFMVAQRINFDYIEETAVKTSSLKQNQGDIK